MLCTGMSKQQVLLALYEYLLCEEYAPFMRSLGEKKHEICSISLVENRSKEDCLTVVQGHPGNMNRRSIPWTNNNYKYYCQLQKTYDPCLLRYAQGKCSYLGLQGRRESLNSVAAILAGTVMQLIICEVCSCTQGQKLLCSSVIMFEAQERAE